VVGPDGKAVATVAGLSIPEHDHIGLSYTGGNLTGVVYKAGGSGGTTVGTLTLAYDGSGNLTSITKS
jgi:2',3'-cyclic-nucleotide 2'-phosphodiesterase (5'-nucleotidase family)